MASDPDIEHDAANQRYVLNIDGERIGMLVYHDDGAARVITHTEVEDEHEGEGLGSSLVRFALDDIRNSDLKVTPQCPMVAAYIREHEEYADLVG